MSSSAYRENPVVMAKLEKHRLYAVAFLIKKVFFKLDPTTGDASCQVRAIVALYFFHLLDQNISADEWTQAQDLADAFLAAHKNDKADTKVKTAADAKGAAHSAEFDGFADRVRSILCDEDFELLGLMYSLWATGIVSTDEFWIDFRYRSNNQWGIHDRELRARLAALSSSKFIDIARTLPNGDILATALTSTQSVIRTEGAPDVPVLAIQPTFTVAADFAFHYRMPIIIALIRIQIDETEPEITDPADRADSPEPSLAGMTYSLGTAQTLLFWPNPATGKFEFVANPTEVQKNAPGFFIKAWSSYYQGSTKPELYSADHQEYSDAFQRINIPWAFDVYTALHPVFSRKADNADLDVARVYESFIEPQARALDYDRYDLAALNYNTPTADRPTLIERIILATRIAIQRGLGGDCQAVRMGAPADKCTWRVGRDIDFQITHVHAGTYIWATAQLAALTARHIAAKNPIIGRFVFALGAVGGSHENEEVATALHNTRNEKTRRTKYLADYPTSAPLLERTE